MTYQSYEDNEHLATEIVNDPISFLGNSFDANSDTESENSSSQIALSNQKIVKDFDSIHDLVKHLPEDLKQPFLTKNTMTSRSNYAETAININKACCGSYPNRRPYRPADLKTGEVKFCCGSNTYNPSRLQCCEGNHLQKFCSDGVVKYGLD